MKCPEKEVNAMGGFKLICCQCGSDKVLEKSGDKKISCNDDGSVYAEGIHRKCTECSNEAFILVRSRLKTDG